MLLALARLLRISGPAYARIKSLQICERTDRLKSEEQHEESRLQFKQFLIRNNHYLH